MPGGPHLTRHFRLPAAVLGVAGGLLAGCSDAVDVAAPAPTGEAETVCRTLLEASPATVAGQTTRPVSSDGAALAWGYPPIVLRCGVDAAGSTPGSRCDEVAGVGWYTEDLGEAYRFTTIGREVPVEVTVPHEYAPEADVLVDLAAAVNSADPVVRRCV